MNKTTKKLVLGSGIIAFVYGVVIFIASAQAFSFARAVYLEYGADRENYISEASITRGNVLSILVSWLGLWLGLFILIFLSGFLITKLKAKSSWSWVSIILANLLFIPIIILSTLIHSILDVYFSSPLIWFFAVLTIGQFIIILWKLNQIITLKQKLVKAYLSSILFLIAHASFYVLSLHSNQMLILTYLAFPAIVSYISTIIKERFK